MNLSAPSRKKMFFILLCKIIFILTFIIAMLFYPQAVFQAALRGLDAWWRIVFPALLPFFVVSEMLMALGIVHFLGVLLEPIMRPLFNVPGSGAFVVAVGYTSGAPIGAALTSQLREKNLCTKTEAERLISFTSNASPLFMFSAVAVGMFNHPELGIVIAGAHYLANLVMGIILRFYNCNGKELSTVPSVRGSIIKSAFQALEKAYQADGRTIGKLLGDAIRNSINTLLTVGGFVIIFSVIIEILSTFGIIKAMGSLLAIILSGFNFNQHLYNTLSSGIIEMTIGAKLTSEVQAPLTQQLVIVSIILGWLGLSIHAQTKSMIADTDISLKPYLLTRIGHGLLASVFTFIFLKNKSTTVSLLFVEFNNKFFLSPWLMSLELLKICFFIILILLCISLSFNLLGRFFKLRFKL
ncbi:sporulation integral membrane protein YlbJ [Bacillota bacterium LX-D]|nr:sporulation integral membrane protein YlbJ [Bacillota bacterium LX-D]